MAAPSLATWRKTLGDSTFGVVLSQLTPQDQNAIYQKFLVSYTKKPDLIGATADAVMSFQTEQRAAQAKAKARPAQSGTSPQPGTAPAGATGATSAQDVQNQVGSNPAVSGLFSGPNASAATSLFSSSGLDLSTKVSGQIPGTITSTGESLGGRGAEGPPDKKAGSYTTRVTQTAEQWLTGLYRMSPAELSALQAQMFQAGWYDTSAVKSLKDVPLGRIDPETIKAYESVMQEAARYNKAGNPLTIEQTLAHGGPSTGSAGAYKQPSFDITNPINTAAAFQSAAQSVVGGGLNPAEQAQFQGAFTGEEAAAYKSFAAAGQDRSLGLGGAYIGRPDAGAAAKQYILAHNQQDVVNYDMALRTMQFEQALKEL